MKKIIIIILIVVILVLSYFYFSGTQPSKIFTRKVYDNYTCTFKGETVYEEISYESGIADGFASITLYDKNHNKIDSGTSGGFSGATTWKNNIGFDGTNCIKN